MKRILASAVLVLTGIAGTLVYVHDNWTNGSTTLKPASDQSASPASLPASTPETVETVVAADSTTTTPPPAEVTVDVNKKLTQVDQTLSDHEDRISKLEITTTTTNPTKKDIPVVQADPISPADPTTTTTTQPKVWVEVARFTAPLADSFRQPDQMSVHLETGVLRVGLKKDSTTSTTEFAVWINDGETYAPTAETVLAGPVASSMDGVWPAGDHMLSLGAFNPDRVKKWIGLTTKEYGRIGTVVVEELR